MFKNINDPTGISYIALSKSRKKHIEEPDYEWECQMLEREIKVLRAAFFVFGFCAVASELITTLVVRFM